MTVRLTSEAYGQQPGEDFSGDAATEAWLVSEGYATRDNGKQVPATAKYKPHQDPTLAENVERGPNSADPDDVTDPLSNPIPEDAGQGDEVTPAADNEAVTHPEGDTPAEGDGNPTDPAEVEQPFATAGDNAATQDAPEEHSQEEAAPNADNPERP